MLQRLQKGHPIDDLQPVATAADVLAVPGGGARGPRRRQGAQVHPARSSTPRREHEDVLLGGSPRASIALFRTAQALAAISGRNFVLPDDVKRMVQPVLAHRLILKPESRLRKVTPAAVLERDRGGRRRCRSCSGPMHADDIPRISPISCAAKRDDLQQCAGSSRILVVLVVALVIQSGLLAYAALRPARRAARHPPPDARAGCNHVDSRTDRVRPTRSKPASASTSKSTVRNAGRLPMPWVLARRSLARLRPASSGRRGCKVKGKRLQIRLLRGRAGDDAALQARLHRPRLLPDRPAGAGERRPVRPAPPLPRRRAAGVRARLPARSCRCSATTSPSRRPIGDVRLTHRLYEDPTRIAGVRPYEAGDPLNRIHWRATARTGRLHSKVYEPSTLAGATILLDFHHGRLPAAAASRTARIWR